MATLVQVVKVVVQGAKQLTDLANSAVKTEAALDSVQKKADTLNAALAGNMASVRTLASAYDDLRNSAAGAAAAQKTVTAATLTSGDAATRAYRPWFSLWSLWGRKVALFGGLLTIGGLHLLIDVIAEVAAVVIPATLALGAFGVAGSDAALNIVRVMTNLHTVMDATGKAIFPMTGALEQLHKAVTPEVYAMFGAALAIMNEKTAEFSHLAIGAGTVLDQLTSRIQLAITSPGVSQFLKNAVADLAKLGDVVGNVFGIAGNLLKALPGYAERLLSILDGVTHGLEVITGSGVTQGIAKVGLGFHGAAIYGGLLVTAVLAIAPLLGRAVSWAAGIGKTATATGQLAENAGRLAKTKAAISDIGTGIAVMAGRSEKGASIVARLGGLLGRLTSPAGLAVLAIGAVTAGIIAFALWAGRGRSAIQQMTAALQASIDRQVTVSGVINATRYAVQQTTAAYKGNLATVNNLSHSTTMFGASQQAATQAVGQARIAAGQAEQAHKQFSGTLSAEQFRLGELQARFGTVTHATDLMGQAHIRLSKFLTESGHAARLDLTTLSDLELAYRAVASASGNFDNNLAILDKQSTDTYKAIQALNQAWDTQTAAVTGTQSAFDNMALGLKTLNNSATTASNTLGKAHLTIGGLGNAIDGLSKKDLALNQAFSTQVTNVNSLIDTWRTAGIAGNQFTKGVKDAISPLTRYAHGSQEATAQLVSLAEEAGYKGPNSLKALTKWLGNAHDATQNVKDITNQATIQEGLLTSSMQAQGSFIADKLIGDINNAILSYNNVQKAAAAYGNAVAKDGQQSDQAHTARQALISDIIKSGQAAGDSTKQIAALISKVLHIPAKAALRIVMTGEGSFTIHSAGTLADVRARVRGASPTSGALGAYISTGSPGKDSVLANVRRGELIVPPQVVASGAVDHLRGSIPGFASGGLVEQGNLGVLSGQYAVNMARQFQNTMTTAMVSAMRAALKAAEASAQRAAAQTFGGGLGRAGLRYLENLWTSAGGPGGGTAHVAAAIALAESGGNPNAFNPSGASGLWQILGAVAPGNLFNPQVNALNAVIKYRDAGGFSPWVTYESGAYLQFMANGGMARPGWAVVGEKGPELISMRGGEQVVPGYARGTSPGVMEKILDEAMTAGQLRRTQHKLLERIADNFTGEARKRRDKALALMVTAAQAQITAAKALQGSIRSGLSGYADLSTTTLGGGYTMRGGREVHQTGGQVLTSELHARLATLRKFATALRRLSSRGLPSSLMQQIVALGPDSGLQYAQEILAGGDKLIDSLAGTEKAIRASEKGIAHGVAFGFAAGGILNEPILGFGRSGRAYAFAEHGPERITPVGGKTMSGPLVNIEHYAPLERADAALMASRISFMITSAGLGS